MDTIIAFILYAFRFLSIVLIIETVLSWVIRNPYNPLMRVLSGITSPLLEPIRKIIPRPNGIDFSPFVLIILLNVLSRVIVSF